MLKVKEHNNTDSNNNNIIDFNTYKSQSISYNNKLKELFSLFDEHFYNFITYRQQRDNFIYDFVLISILENCTFDDDYCKKNSLTKFFEIKNNKLSISKDLLYINQNIIVKCIEKEIEILKTYNYFFDKVFVNNRNVINIKNIDYLSSELKYKMDKIKDLNDKSFIDRITNSEKIKEKILNNVPQIKTFLQINVNKIFFQKLINDFEIKII